MLRGSARQQGISADTALVELGVDSLALAQLKGQLEGEYGCVLPDEVMFRETTTLRVLTILVKEGFDEETYSRTVAAFEIETVTIKERGGGDPLIEGQAGGHHLQVVAQPAGE